MGDRGASVVEEIDAACEACDRLVDKVLPALWQDRAKELKNFPLKALTWPPGMAELKVLKLRCKSLAQSRSRAIWLMEELTEHSKKLTECNTVLSFAVGSASEVALKLKEPSFLLFKKHKEALSLGKDPKTLYAKYFVAKRIPGDIELAASVFLDLYKNLEDTDKLLHLLQKRSTSSVICEAHNVQNWTLVVGVLNLLQKVSSILNSPRIKNVILHELEIKFFQQASDYLYSVVFNSKLRAHFAEPAPITDSTFHPIYFVQQDFKKVVGSNKNFKILEIPGDGNCFFRSVIRHMFPMIPRDYEDTLSFALRKLLNQGVQAKKKEAKKAAKKEESGKAEEETTVKKPTKGADKKEDVEKSMAASIHEFVEDGINDSVTMAKAGVWADHLQVVKLSKFIGRQIWILRFDDKDLTVDKDGKFKPSVFNQVGSGKLPGDDPMYLHYTPNPGHYEPVVSVGAGSEFTCADLEAHLADGREITPHELLSTWLSIEQQGAIVQRLAAQLHDISYTEYDTRSTIRADANQRLAKLVREVIAFRRCRDLLGEGYLSSMLKRHPVHYKIFGSTVENLLKDEILFVGKELVMRGHGQMSFLFSKAEHWNSQFGHVALKDITISAVGSPAPRAEDRMVVASPGPAIKPVELKEEFDKVSEAPAKDVLDISVLGKLAQWKKFIDEYESDEIVFSSKTINVDSLKWLLSAKHSRSLRITFSECTFPEECIDAFVLMEEQTTCVLRKCKFTGYDEIPAKIFGYEGIKVEP